MSFTTRPISRRLAILAATATLVPFIYGCASVPANVSVAETIAKTPSLSTLNGLLVKSGLSNTFKDGGPYTFFAPSDDAFKAVPAKTLDELGKNPDRLKDVLNYHVIAGKQVAASIKNSKAKSLQGTELELSKSGEFVTLESAAVTTADIEATNGVVHIIDTVLIPPAKK